MRSSEGRFRWVQYDGQWNYEPRMWNTGSLLDDGARWDLLPGDATIIALGLTDQETADDLRRLAEVFEVREAVSREFAVWRVVQQEAGGDDVFSAKGEDMDRCVDRLHAAGWRPGMTAEDAARMLAGT